MTVANGYNFTYATYKGDYTKNNGTAGIGEKYSLDGDDNIVLHPKISVSFGLEQNNNGTTSSYEDIVPVSIRVKINMEAYKIEEVGAVEEYTLAKVIDDVKKKFAFPNVFPCSAKIIMFQYVGEEEVDFALEKDDKTNLYVWMQFQLTYRTART
jgi:hypothetical protein